MAKDREESDGFEIKGNTISMHKIQEVPYDTCPPHLPSLSYWEKGPTVTNVGVAFTLYV
jgi:hypothetical protein